MSDPQSYTVGWICAITIESVAARAFLDEEHDGPSHVSEHDNNSYVLGKIGYHNVVIAVLPDGEYGTTSAAAVARDMLHSFPNVRIGLMVGIGGGAPSSKHDIRLGDVVVSSRDGGKGGVFQYDFGKTIQNQAFEETGFLDQPPMVLRTAVSALKGTYELNGHQLVDEVEKASNRIKKRKKYKQPPPTTDRLYHPDAVHPITPDGCDVTCDATNLMPRDVRDEEEDDPAIHYGLIASGSQLMKDAHIRDKLVAKKGVLCFEMEAAGLMNHFPCLVIRGICDYSDSHKNKEWQGFAAMMAAAYAKDLLRQIPPNKVETERRITETLVTIEQKIGAVHQSTVAARAVTELIQSDLRTQEMRRWLHPPDPSTNANHARKLRHEGTGAWLLETPVFQSWQAGSRQHLWLHGLAGCGKTVLTATVLDHLKAGNSGLILSFFFDFSDTTKQTVDYMLRSLASQLYQGWAGSASPLDASFQAHQNGHDQPATEALEDVVYKMLTVQKDVYIVLDALDESMTRSELLSWIRDTTSRPELDHVHLLYTSRSESEFLRNILPLIGEESCLLLYKEAVNADIRLYVTAQLLQRRDFQEKHLPSYLLEQIITRVGNGADGM
ncbi:hypothetical protein G7Z17_g6991 [Cylindrodendrum hubeiense]|uniref:NACHT domain-containing protein n=1 Tax=Cylindrodendrum hubeiense TaxID=595255 RepID=A0A9P5HE22_9HYPO|nr:hypothetical protein G7Z17_g6991 [Cylindrodendrum hubeiense]